MNLPFILSKTFFKKSGVILTSMEPDTENDFSVITSRVNISCRGRVFWPTKGTGGLQHHNFLFLMENSIIKIFGSMNVKITPDFCS